MQEFNYEQLNSYGEADVREEMIAPVIRELGYKTGTHNDIIRELTLTYDRASLGRQKATDPLLRGRADYILDANRRVRWVIEAKSPSENIGAAEIAQCWTYANHPEVRGVYFVLCNGFRWVAFQTSRGPNESPIIELENSSFEEIVARLGELVHPSSLMRDFPDIPRPSGAPLGPGLRSTCKIIGGHYVIEEFELPAAFRLDRKLPEGMVISITGGTAERVDEKIQASYKTQANFQQLQELNEVLGLNELTLITNSATLSVDPQNPTKFTASQSVLMPRGTKLFDFMSQQAIALPFDMPVQTEVTAHGILQGNEFIGRFESPMRMSVQGMTVQANQRGRFELKLA